MLKALREELGRAIVGQDDMVETLLLGLLTGGHVLLEGVPGLAKTLAMRTLAQALQAEHQRVQFTPDLLPADLTGTQIYRHTEGDFITRKGPVFTNLLLADEINRAPAKVQSALLQAMEEHQVTIGEETYSLPQPFLVLATQNTIEQEGTYALPAAQVDRFLFKVLLDYPSAAEEREVLRRHREGFEPVRPVASPEQLFDERARAEAVTVAAELEDYIVRLVAATRDPASVGAGKLQALIRFGASPRASVGLMNASRALAHLRDRSYVVPDDVQSVASRVLRHRMLLSFEAEAEEKTSDDLIADILAAVPVP
jgi:MoxR-like ATPase